MKTKILLALSLLAGPVAMAQTYTVDVNVPGISTTPNDAFSYANKLVSHYGLGWYNETSTTLYGYLSGYYGLRLFTSGQPRFVVDISGNVGIGTTTPNQKLSVSGNILASAAANEGPGLILENPNKTGNAQAHRWVLYNMTGPYGESLQFWNYNQGSTMYAPRFTLADNGNVGIGTTTPNEKLAVNGKIRAREIKVETANWPDYVFEESYKVGTLKELESYIKANRHLPDMPSAKEAEANGVELGEMNKLLLKKVEELTLHLIEKDKRLQNVEAKQKEMEALLKKLTEKK